MLNMPLSRSAYSKDGVLKGSIKHNLAGEGGMGHLGYAVRQVSAEEGEIMQHGQAFPLILLTLLDLFPIPFSF